MQNVVIIGASHAGVEAAFSLRRFGFLGEIILISREKDFPYQKPPLSKLYLSNAIETEQLFLKPKQLFEKKDIKVILQTEILKIDRLKKCLVGHNNNEINYNKLIIATGARARKLNATENENLNLYYLRKLSDVLSIKSNLNKQGHVLIIGAGYIGLEIAASLKKLGHDITIIEREKNVLNRVSGKDVSKFLLDYHQQQGIHFKFNCNINSFEKEDEKFYAVTDSDKIKYDICIIGIGVVVNDSLAKEANLKVENGIWVNEKCRTEDEDIYAIGDCSNHLNKFAGKRIRLESVPNAMGQAKVAASNICGNEMRYSDIPWFWSNQYDLKLQTVGIFNAHTDCIIRKDTTNTMAVYYYKDDVLIACDTINQPKDYMLAKKMIDQNISPKKDLLKDSTLDIKEIYAQCLASN